jgi:opacity protein-like surface antigen
MRALLAVFFLTAMSSSALAQTKPAPPTSQNRSPQQPSAPAKPAPPTQKPATQTRPATTNRPNDVRARGFGTFGAIMFQAQDSFDAIFGSNAGLTFGGGGQVLFPYGLYAEVGLWQFKREGERAFVGPNDEVFPLGIPLEVTIRPIEITGGWRYRHCPGPPRAPRTPQPPPRGPQKPVTPARPQPARSAQTAPRSCDPKFIPYGGGGFSLVQYRETSEPSDASDDVDERFNGFHILGGAEYRVMRWMAVGGEVMWSSVADALGAGGVSAAFDENNLGGIAFRLKVTVGR